MKKIPVFTASKAIKDYNEKVIGFQDILSRLRPQFAEPVMPMQDTQSLESIMIRSGLPSTFSSKSSLAKQFGMPNYFGTTEQDAQLAQMLQARGERMNSEQSVSTEKMNREQDLKMKDREFSLKEKELESKIQPTADEIADSILTKYQE